MNYIILCDTYEYRQNTYGVIYYNSGAHKIKKLHYLITLKYFFMNEDFLSACYELKNATLHMCTTHVIYHIYNFCNITWQKQEDVNM